MANRQSHLEASLKVPAIEVVDLLSDGEPDNDITAQFHQQGSYKSLGLDKEKDDDEEEEDDEEEQWDSESLYEDALEEDDDVADDVTDACTLDQKLAFRKRLRVLGEDDFIRETIENGSITAKKLCTAFGIRPPSFLEGAPDNAYYPLLGLGMTRELTKRVKLPNYNTIDDVVSLLKKSKNIIVLTGAGISTSLGIPDFRSKDTGLYSQLEQLGLSDPQEVFDINIFREDPSIFYSVAKDILPATSRFSPTHGFIRLLQEKGKLLTNFTQNIDNLEGHAGILKEKLVQCHGSFATASCTECGYKVPCDEIYKDLKTGRVARCDRCMRKLRQSKPSGLKRKRSSNGVSTNKRKRQDYEDSTDDEDYDIAVAGVMKPDITFFGEDLPATFHDRLVKHDKDLVDLVLVIGTSLKVAPVSEVVGFLPASVPQIYISRTPCSHVNFDVDLLGDCDIVVAELCKRAGWEFRHEMVPQDQVVDTFLHEGYESRYSIQISTRPVEPR